MTIESDHYNLERLEAGLKEDVAQLLNHPLYLKLQTLKNIRIFMASHVFAVWDFMSLLKSLQARVTCVQAPWVPMKDSNSVRFINEIVLAEESDEISPGVFLSHYELYLQAMDEVGADTKSVRALVCMLSEGRSLEDSMREIELPLSTKEFVQASFENAQAPLHMTAAYFCFGREDIIAPMFQIILDEIENQVGIRCDAFRIYLKRHIEIDKDTHGPLAKKMLSNICGQDPTKWNEALMAAKSSIRMRNHLWDGVLRQINNPDKLM